MKKHLTWAVLPLAALLVACGQPTPTSNASSVPPTTTSVVPSSEVPTPSSEAPTPSSEAPAPSSEVPAPSSEASAPSSEAPVPVDHLEAYGKVASAAEQRKFDERFDAMVDDFSGDALAGTTDGVRHNGFLRALVDNNVEPFPKTADAAIYKVASGSYEAMNFGANGIGFRMRVSRGKLALKNLRLELRGDDAFQTYPIQLVDARDSDNEALPELTGEFQDFLINPGQSIEDENTVYKNVDGTDSSTTVLGKILGFHLVANDIEVGGELEIDEVFTYVGTTRTVLDDFNRVDVERVPNAWWGGSASGFIVRRGVKLEGGKAYTTPVLTNHTHLVLTALGDSTGTKIIGLNAAGEKTNELTWAAAKGIENDIVPLANGEYGDYAIELAKLGAAVAKIKIVSSTPIEIAGAFLTSLEVPNLDLSYPRINPTVVMDDFTGDVASLDADWDASAAKQVNIDAGRTGFVSYALGDQINVKDGVLNLPATDNYAEVTIGHLPTYLDENAKYVVIAAKGEDLNLMRFLFRGKGSDSAVYFNAGLAAEGVKAYGSAEIPSPYVDAAGFTHYVFDLAQNGLAVGDTFDLYYTGAHAAQISSIYFAVDDLALNKAAEKAPADTGVMDLTAWHYGGGIEAAPTDYFGVEIAEASGGADFSSFRVMMNEVAKWLKDGAINAYYEDGHPVAATDKIPETGCTIYFDLSVYEEPIEHFAHLHVGGLEGAVGSVKIAKLIVAGRGYVDPLGGIASATINKDYVYVGNVKANAPYDFLMITLAATGTNMTYECFRMNVDGNNAFFNNPATYSATHADGTPVVNTDVIPAEGETILLDLSKSAFKTYANAYIHVEYGGWSDPVGTLTIQSIVGCSVKTPYEAIAAKLPK